MRKSLFIILGLLIVVGAGATFAYRQMLLSNAQLASRQVERSVREGSEGQPSPSARRGVDREAFGNEGGEGRSRAKGGNWRLVEIALDVLNILVGIAGIGLAIMGGRMQRRAMAMEQTQGRQRSEM